MKTKVLTIIPFMILLCMNLQAQAFLQLLPRTFYKEDCKLTNADWAGFYRTSVYDEMGQSIMLLLPFGDTLVGFCASEDSRWIRLLEGTKKGNSIDYKYWIIDTKGKKDTKAGHGTMVMKDDPERNDVYCKHGDAKGLGEQKGCFTAGKKLAIEYKSPTGSSLEDWMTMFRINDKPPTDKKSKKAIFSNMRYSDKGVYGDYAFEYSYSVSDSRAVGISGLTRTTTKKYTFPKSKVQIMGLPYGDTFAYILVHGDGSEVGAGYLTMKPDKLSYDQEEVWGKIKKLGKK
jgi:hypothetical protein